MRPVCWMKIILDDGYPLAKTPAEMRSCYPAGRERNPACQIRGEGRVETLLLRYGIGYEDVDKVYLAGGFGYKINLDKAISIGLLPEELHDKIEAVGNSSLGGTVFI